MSEPEQEPERSGPRTPRRAGRAWAATGGETTLWAGVACYPAHAFDSDEILTQTEQALQAARDAMDLVASRTGATRFVVAGLCSGADSSYAVA